LSLAKKKNVSLGSEWKLLETMPVFLKTNPKVSKHFLSLVPLHCTEINWSGCKISRCQTISSFAEKESVKKNSSDTPPTDGFLAQNSHSTAQGRGFY
jgi:hypothetical protein